MIKSIVAKLFNLYTDEDVRLKLIQKENELRDKDTEDGEAIKALVIEVDIGSTFISVTNEWDNPTIGIVLGVEFVTKGNCPIALVYDFVTDQLLLCGNSRMPYSYYNLDAILRLDPYQRWNLIARSNTEQDKDKVNPDCFTSGEITQILEMRNFNKVRSEIKTMMETFKDLKTSIVLRDRILLILVDNGLSPYFKE